MENNYFVCRDDSNQSTFITKNVKKANRDNVSVLHSNLSKANAYKQLKLIRQK